MLRTPGFHKYRLSVAEKRASAALPPRLCGPGPKINLHQKGRWGPGLRLKLNPAHDYAPTLGPELPRSDKGALCASPRPWRAPVGDANRAPYSRQDTHHFGRRWARMGRPLFRRPAAHQRAPLDRRKPINKLSPCGRLLASLIKAVNELVPRTPGGPRCAP